MSRRKNFLIFLVLTLPLALAACTAAPAQNTPAATPVQPRVTKTAKAPTAIPGKISEPTAPALATQTDTPVGETDTGETLEDAQGAVTVAVTPVNLSQPGGTVDFEVAMNTHSVDLSMDLSQLSTLATDTGKTLQPSLWDAPMGGHHVSGTLSFPADASFLDGAKTVTLTIREVDAPERVFTWQLP